MATLPLLRRDITLDEALDDDDNILARLDYPGQQRDFWDHLSARKNEVEDIVRFHLGAKSCQVADKDAWLVGSYNNPVGEANNPGNVEEKLRCEVATYIWIHENCPDVPIPTLLGCGFPDGQTFTNPAYASPIHRLYSSITRTIRSWLNLPTPCSYIPQTRPSSLETGYMIIPFITNGRMLSDTFLIQRHNPTKRTNLFRSMAQITLSLTQKSHPRIGSLSLTNTGSITLKNRPLTFRLQTHENESIPTIPRSTTYSSIEPYLLDLLESTHDNRITQQPNSIHNTTDGQQQLAALACMRAILPRFISREYRSGPFFLTLTDLHQSNILVDDEWNIISLIDLE